MAHWLCKTQHNVEYCEEDPTRNIASDIQTINLTLKQEKVRKIIFEASKQAKKVRVGENRIKSLGSVG